MARAWACGLVGRTVVGHDPLDHNALAGEIGDGSVQEPDGHDHLLVLEDFDVGQATGVVDGHVAVLPAGAVDSARDLDR